MGFSWLQSIGLIPRRPTAMRRDEVGCAGDPSHLLTTSEAHPGFVATCSGRLFDVVHPQPAEIEIDEISHALSQINRFGGHTKYPYSVAQHSCLCADECERQFPGWTDAAFACLLHDAAEAYCGDVIRPMKRLIGSVYRPIENGVQRAVWQRFSVEIDDEIQRVIHSIDNAVVMTESRQLMRGSDKWNWAGTQSAPLHIYCLTPMQAKADFLARFDRLYGYIE